jgi:hypothetical protein
MYVNPSSSSIDTDRINGTPVDAIVYVKVNGFITELLPYNFANLRLSAIYFTFLAFSSEHLGSKRNILVTKIKPGMALNHPWQCMS